MRTLVIAVDQTRPVPGDPDASFKEYAGRIRAIHETFPQVQLVLHPELHLPAPAGLLDEPAAYARHVAVDVPGPLTETRGLARETKLWLAPGSVSKKAPATPFTPAISSHPPASSPLDTASASPGSPTSAPHPEANRRLRHAPARRRHGPHRACHLLEEPSPGLPAIRRPGAEFVLQPTLTPTRGPRTRTRPGPQQRRREPDLRHQRQRQRLPLGVGGSGCRSSTPKGAVRRAHRPPAPTSSYERPGP